MPCVKSRTISSWVFRVELPRMIFHTLLGSSTVVPVWMQMRDVVGVGVFGAKVVAVVGGDHLDAHRLADTSDGLVDFPLPFGVVRLDFEVEVVAEALAVPRGDVLGGFQIALVLHERLGRVRRPCRRSR